MVEENKKIVRRLFEAWSKQDLAVLDEIMIPDYVDNDMLPGQTEGREGYKQISAYLFSAFPDSKLTIDDMIAEGDKVVVRSTFTGTQKGEIMGIAPTNKHIETEHINIYRIADGKLVEEWSGRRNSSPTLEKALKGD